MAQRDSDSANTAFSLGEGARMGNVSVGGHVAGRDVVVTMTTTTEAAAAQDMAQVLEVVAKLQDQIGNLSDAPSGLREDAQDELHKAHQAGSDGDTQRLVEKLGTAQGYLERIGQSLPAAIGLAQAVATLVARIGGLG